MVKEFKRDPSRREVKETPMSQPTNTFSLTEFEKVQQTNHEESKIKVGRPRKNKVYGTIRIQKYNVNRINALQNTLDYETQDDLVAALLDRLENSIESEQRTMFDMYMRTYEAKSRKKEK
ncbi:DUF5388 domain-containing protein [Enterococcus sp. AZ103]|uniref:DUF5388 domain-containing protein n=1 Tax=Enterococcus sp. AZ103 TaxID=2774628 RepID=UPI003F1EE11C